MLVAVHDYAHALLRRSGVDPVGPFTVGLDPVDAGPFRNYAVPDRHREPTDQDVADLIEAFERNGRQPRLEYLPAASPGLEDRLVAAGFQVERRIPVMTCPPEKLRIPEVAPGYAFSLARSDAELWGAEEAAHEAYGDGAPTQDDLDRIRRSVAAGGLMGAMIHTETGEVAASGACAAPAANVSELAGVGTRERFRRRGLAAAVTAYLTKAAAEAGIPTVFLTPAGEREARIYRSVGYQDGMEMIHISR